VLQWGSREFGKVYQLNIVDVKRIILLGMDGITIGNVSDLRVCLGAFLKPISKDGRTFYPYTKMMDNWFLEFDESLDMDWVDGILMWPAP
jgi:hypothetical protein